MITFLEFLNEGASFELAGKKYSSAFGRYKCDGRTITKDEYAKASADYKASKGGSKVSKPEKKEKYGPHNVYTPSSEDLEKRPFKPKVSHSNGTYSVDVPALPEYNAGGDGKNLTLPYEKNMGMWFDKYSEDMKSRGYETDEVGFKRWVKGRIGGKLEDMMSTAIMTDKERSKVYDGFVDAAYNFIEKNYKKISKA